MSMLLLVLAVAAEPGGIVGEKEFPAYRRIHFQCGHEAAEGNRLLVRWISPSEDLDVVPIGDGELCHVWAMPGAYQIWSVSTEIGPDGEFVDQREAKHNFTVGKAPQPPPGPTPPPEPEPKPPGRRTVIVIYESETPTPKHQSLRTKLMLPSGYMEQQKHLVYWLDKDTKFDQLKEWTAYLEDENIELPALVICPFDDKKGKTEVDPLYAGPLPDSLEDIISKVKEHGG